MSDVTRLLDAVEKGEPNAAEELLPLVYEELRRLAAYRMAAEPAGQTLQATALIHEAWIRLVGQDQQHYRGREHFIAAASEAMRRILVDNARRKARLKRGAGARPINLDDLEIAFAEPDERIVLVNEALEAFEKEEPEKATVVKLRCFVGLNHQEVADVLGLSEKTVKRYWNYSKAWLYEAIDSRQRA
jgi:RNA polymerase sigma factor (TIGR02999 family)